MQQQRKPKQNQGQSVRRYPDNGHARPKSPQPQRPPQKQSVGQRGAQSGGARQTQKKSGGREWVYPEGYRPPARKQPQKNQPKGKPPVKKRKAPKQDYTFLLVFLGELGLRLLIGAVIGISILGLVYRNKFYTVPEDKRDDVVYTFSHVEEDEEVTSVFEVSAARAYRGENLMVSFSDIAAWLDMAQVGDIHTMRFVVRGEEDEGVVFHYNSHNAFIGNETVVMDCETRFEGGEVWVPLSFVQDCMTGLDVTVEGEKVLICRNGDGPGFKLKASEPITPCEYPE